MAKYKTLELHLISLQTTRLGASKYRHDLTLRDWDDGEEVSLTVELRYPISAVTAWKIRVLTEDLPESPPG